MRSVTSPTAAWNAGSFTVSLSLWMNTDSLTGRRPERSSATSALWDSPENWSTSEMFVVPIALPAMNTTTTNGSQPQNAFLRCRPLQAAMRAARLCFEEEVDMPAPDACVRRRPLWVRRCIGRVSEPVTLPAACSGAGQPDHTPAGRALLVLGKTRLGSA